MEGETSVIHYINNHPDITATGTIDIDVLDTLPNKSMLSNSHHSHFFYTDYYGYNVKNYQTDLEAIVGNLEGNFRFGISPEGYIATIMSDKTPHDFYYDNKYINNVVSAIFELKPVIDNKILDIESISYKKVDGTYIPAVDIYFSEDIHGTIFATEDNTGVAIYTGPGLSTIEEPHIFIRNQETPTAYLHELVPVLNTGKIYVNNNEITYTAGYYRWKESDWDKNRGLFLVKYNIDGKHVVLFRFDTLENAKQKVEDLIKKIGKEDEDIARIFPKYSQIIKNKDIDVYGKFIRHLETVVDKYATVPQRIRIDGKPTSTWGEQLDQVAIPIKNIYELGIYIDTQDNDNIAPPDKEEEIYKIGEIVELMHFFPEYGSFSASLPFDASPQPLITNSSQISYSASGGYGGMEWPGRDGSHIATDLAKDGWHRYNSGHELYEDTYTLVNKLIEILDKKTGDSIDIPFSWGPWEHFNGYLAYTGIQISMAYKSASEIARELGDNEKADIWARKYEALKKKTIEKFWDSDRGYFIRSEYDTHLDTSPNLSAILTEFLDLHNPEERNMAEKIIYSIEKRATSFGGILRMEDEYYIGRNPWFVSTGQYIQSLEKLSQALSDIEPEKSEYYHNKAKAYLEWSINNSNISGTFPEQKIFHQPPRTNLGSDIKPLDNWTLLPWSEAEIREAIRNYYQESI